MQEIARCGYTVIHQSLPCSWPFLILTDLKLVIINTGSCAACRRAVREVIKLLRGGDAAA